MPKARTSVQASASLAASPATTSTTGRSMASVKSAVYTVKITNGTAPTAAAYAVLELGDNTNWDEFQRGYADTVASSVTTFALEVPTAASFTRLRFVGATGQAVTIQAEVHEET